MKITNIQYSMKCGSKVLDDISKFYNPLEYKRRKNEKGYYKKLLFKRYQLI